jgi:putative ABC transport system ATP-binding protein
MELRLENLIPIPLKEKLAGRSSDIWNQERKYEGEERIKIVAPSGTGKTTLVHILYKLRNDYEGNIYWNGSKLQNLAGDELARIRQQEVSIIFQDMRLFDNLTARENIELKRVLHEPSLYSSSVIEEMAGELGITGILNQKASVCSYGEQQRVAIIRALVQPFKWLIMDEPFSHLDKANTAKAASLIAAECSKRKSGFIITDLDEDHHFNYTQQYRL